ncbi:MAG: hypothetical protein K2G79_02925 [Muribaculum sp.]|nr:hypothetical protein [Muribaculum sp.]
MMGKHSKTFSGTAPASKAASLPGILWPPVSDRDSMTAIQAFTIQTPYEYCGNYEYIRGKLSRINTPTGYYENGRHYFYIKDYQGNIRCTVADNDSLTKAVHYYPGARCLAKAMATTFGQETIFSKGEARNQMKAIKWAFFNWFGQWNQIRRINSQNRER